MIASLPLERIASVVPGVLYTAIVTGERRFRMPYAAPGIVDLFGLTPAQVAEDASVLLDRIHPEDVDGLVASVREAAVTGASWERQFRVLLSACEEKWIEARSALQTEPDGAQVWYGLLVDVTRRKADERAALLREQEFRALAENSPDAIARYDRDCRRIYVNPTMERMVGRSAPDMIGSTPLEYSTVPDRSEYQTAIRAVMATGTPFSGEMLIRDGSGQARWGHVRIVPEFDANGSVVSAMSIGRDVSELKQREVELRTLLDHFPDFVTRFDVQGRMTYANPALLAAFQAKPEDFLGRTVADLPSVDGTADSVGWCSGALREGLLRAIDEGRSTSVEARCSVGGSVREYEIRHVPEIDPAGGVVGVLCIARDITERKQLQEDLANERVMLRNLIQSMPDPVWLKSPEGVFLACNSAFARVHNAFESDIIGRTDHGLVEPELADFFEQKDREAVETGLPCTNEEWVTYAKDGHRALWETIKTPLYDLYGKATGVLGVARDITDHKRAEEELLRHRERLEDLVRERTAESEAARIRAQQYLDVAGVILMAMDTEHRVSMINEKGCEILKGSRDRIIGKDWFETFVPEHARLEGQLAFDLARSRRGLPVETVEIPTLTLSGEERLIAWHHSLCWDDVGNVVGLLCSGEDVTERKRAEQALKRALDFTNGIINAIPDLLFETDRDGRYLNVWTRTPELLAAQKEILLGKTVGEVLSPEAAGIVMDALREAEESDLSFGRVIRIDLPDEPRWFEVSVSRMAGGSSPDLRFLLLSRDVTDRKRAEEQIRRLNSELEQRVRERTLQLEATNRELRESEERYHQVFENSPVSLWEEDLSGVRAYLNGLKEQGVVDLEDYLTQHPDAVHECARLGRIVDVNRAALEMHGAASKAELLAGLVQTFTPESFDTFRDELICLWNGGREMARDAVVRTLAGERRDVTVYFSVCPGYEQTLSRVIVSLADITERKRAEAALAEREREFRTLADNSPDIIIRYNTEGRRIYVNPQLQKVSGVPTEKAVGAARPALPESYAPRIERLKSLLAEAVNTQAMIETEYQMEQDGTTLTYLLRLVPERDSEGIITSILTIWTDITRIKLLKEALATEQKMLRSLLETIPDPVWMKSPDGVFLAANAAFARLYAVSEADLVGTRDNDYVSADLAAFFQQKDREAIEAGGPRTNEEWVTFAGDGHQALWETVKAPVYDIAGNVIGVLGVARDITERKRMETDLRESESKYRYQCNLHESMLASFADVSIYAVDRDYRYLFFNEAYKKAAKRMWGADISIGASMIDGISDPDHKKFARASIDQAMFHGLAAVESKEKVEKDGRIEYEYHSNYGSPILDDQGNPQGLTVIAFNITERKRAEEERAELQRQLQIITDSLPGAVTYWRGFPDGSGKMLYANRHLYDVFGFTLEDLADDITPMAYRIHSDDLQRSIPLLREAAQELRTYTNEFRVNHPDKGEIWVQQISTPVYESETSLLWYGMMFDVTERKTMERDLASREREYRTLAESSPDVIIRYDRDLRCIYVNPQFERVGQPAFDGASGEVMSRLPAQLSTMLDAFVDRLRGVLTTQDVSESEFVMERDGNPGHYLVRFVPERDSDGQVTSILTFWTDITRLKRLEADLSESRERYREIFDGSLDTLYLLEVIGDGRFRNLEVNPAFERSVGMSREQLIGRTVDETVPFETAERVQAAYRRCVAEERVISGEMELDLPSGKRFFASTLVPVRNQQGRVYRIVGITRDITVERQMEVALRESEERYRQIFNNASDGMLLFQVEPGGRFRTLEANASLLRATGLPSTEVVGHNLHETGGGDISRITADLLGRCIEKGGTLHEEVDVKLMNGWRSFSTSSIPLRDQGGRIDRIVCVVRDITDRLQYEKLARQKQRAEIMGNLAGAVAHDFKNILGTIMLSAGFARMKSEAPSVVDSLRQIEEAAGRADSLIRQMLSFSRPGEMTFDRVSLAKIAREDLRFVAMDATPGIEIRHSLPEDGFYVRADSTQIRQVVLNLCINALQAMTKEGGLLELALGRRDVTEGEEETDYAVLPSGGYVVLTISDTGEGMSSEVQQRLFEPFFTTKPDGHGLGLSIVQSIVQNHGGIIVVHSRPGLGSSFEVLLPEAGPNAVA